MASFTDNLQYLTNYKPYVEQNPVQAMVNVGVEKQRRYDEGVQKIQGFVENVAGQDVVRDVDKSYLQSKLNVLGTNLRTLAAGDFSNYQLVNSVGGLATQIVKDPHVQNAVASTAKYRQSLADMEASKKAGTSSPSNEWDFQTQAAQWLNSSDLKQSFNGSYSPYVNYKKNALEVFKALTKDESITDDAFTVDARGNVVITDTIVRKKLAGISPEKIQQALMANLTPADFKQMETDGRYNYSNVSPEQFVQGIKSSYSGKVKYYEDQKRVLENAKSSTTSVVQKNELNDQINSLDKIIKNVSDEYSGVGEMLSSGQIEAAKAKLHTADFINNFAKSFSYTQTSQTYEASPFAEAARWREGKELDWKKHLMDYELRARQLNLNEAELNYKMQKDTKEASGGGKDGNSLFGGVPWSIAKEDLPKVATTIFTEKTKNDVETLASLDSAFLDKSAKSPEWFEQQKNAWQRTPSSVAPEIAQHFRYTEQLRRTADANQKVISDIENKVKSKFGAIEDLIPAGSEPVYYSNNGVSYTYTPKDFVNFNLNFGKYTSNGGSFVSSAGTGGGKGTQYDYTTAKQELSAKDFHLFQLMGGAIKATTPEDKNLLSEVRRYNTEVIDPYRKKLGDINNFVNDELKNKITWQQGASYDMAPDNKSKDQAARVLNDFASRAGTQDGGMANSKNFDVDVARKLASDQSTTYSITVASGTEFNPSPVYQVKAAGKNGEVIFNITPEEKQAIFGGRFDASPVDHYIQPYVEQINKMGGYSTAYTTGDSTHDNAFLSSIDFPSVQHYGVKANIIQPANGLYSIKLSIFDPVKQVWVDGIDYPKKGLIDKNGIPAALQGLTDAAIYEQLNEVPATDKDIKVVEQASKKPTM